MFGLAHTVFKEIELMANIKKWEISHKNPDFRLLFKKWEAPVKWTQIPAWRQWLEQRSLAPSYQHALSICMALVSPWTGQPVAVLVPLVCLCNTVQRFMKYVLCLLFLSKDHAL